MVAPPGQAKFHARWKDRKLQQWFATGAANKEEVLKFHPLGRIGKPNDIAEVALFLASYCF
jgi:NAD(P)-dependent dehydrogenase (short-subunit alcohol dehydrogenase family)